MDSPSKRAPRFRTRLTSVQLNIVLDKLGRSEQSLFPFLQPPGGSEQSNRTQTQQIETLASPDEDLHLTVTTLTILSLRSHLLHRFSTSRWSCRHHFPPRHEPNEAEFDAHPIRKQIYLDNLAREPTCPLINRQVLQAIAASQTTKVCAIYVLRMLESILRYSLRQ